LDRNTTTRELAWVAVCAWGGTDLQDLPGLAAADHRRELVPVGAVEFGACTVEVALHRAHRHRQSVGNLAIAQACGDEVGDFAFAYGQRQRTAREGIVKLFENACGSVDVSGLRGGT